MICLTWCWSRSKKNLQCSRANPCQIYLPCPDATKEYLLARGHSSSQWLEWSGNHNGDFSDITHSDAWSIKMARTQNLVGKNNVDLASRAVCFFWILVV